MYRLLLVPAALVVSLTNSQSATILDSFEDGLASMTVDSSQSDQGINHFNLDGDAVLGERRRSFVRYISGPGSISVTINTTLEYISDANTLGEQLGLGYGSNFGGNPPMNLNVLGGGADHFVVGVLYATAEIPLQMFFRTRNNGIPSVLNADLPASATPYEAYFPLSSFSLASSADFSDLSGVTVTFGRGLEDIPSGASFAVQELRFDVIPEPSTLTLFVPTIIGLLIHRGHRIRRPTRRG